MKNKSNGNRNILYLNANTYISEGLSIGGGDVLATSDTANLFPIIHNDTQYYETVNVIHSVDSNYTTNKLWVWLFTNGKP